MIEVGALELFIEEADQVWCGPWHYISINENSDSMPLRLVTKSPLADLRMGLTLNSILPKWPIVLNDQWTILVRFREYNKGCSVMFLRCTIRC